MVLFDIPYFNNKIPDQLITVRAKREEIKCFNPSHTEKKQNNLTA
jgi:hypothetical protein